MAAGRYIHTLSNSDDDIEVSDDDDDGVGFKRRHHHHCQQLVIPLPHNGRNALLALPCW